MFWIIVFWIAAISVITLFGSWYARKYDRPDALIGLYVAFVLISNITAYKIAAFDFGFVTFFATAATLVFSVTFLMTDIVNEKFGRKETQKMILIAFVTQIAVAFFIWLAISLEPAPFWPDQEIFAKIMGFAPRAMLAGWIAFLISENVDAYIFSWFKKKTHGRHLWMRNAFSSIPAMALDTLVFVTIAFYGVQPLLPLITGVLVIKWLVGIVDIPFMYFNRGIMYGRKRSVTARRFYFEY
ncbi:MAG: queuosine precursor transporter [Nanoarchaeota archaeon]|nr:queuosine precursor transporter [Nanoarchaeota archaeon]MBU0976927.1 queuosine precursor transporter [Nanoarchaeota archaeon]